MIECVVVSMAARLMEKRERSTTAVIPHPSRFEDLNYHMYAASIDERTVPESATDMSPTTRERERKRRDRGIFTAAAAAAAL